MLPPLADGHYLPGPLSRPHPISGVNVRPPPSSSSSNSSSRTS